MFEQITIEVYWTRSPFCEPDEVIRLPAIPRPGDIVILKEFHARVTDVFWFPPSYVYVSGRIGIKVERAYTHA